ncbi:hypothetical protein [Aeromonas phage AerS_266]|nr:hypothetical protein [Aeromonas phage AerS_266]
MKTVSVKEIVNALSKSASELNQFLNHKTGICFIPVNENVFIELVSNVDGYICSFVSSNKEQKHVVNYSVEYLYGLKSFYRIALLKSELCGYLFDHEVATRFINDEHFVSYVLNEYNEKQSVHAVKEIPTTLIDIEKCLKGIRYLFNTGEILPELQCKVFNV